jgi:hypothetical protein
VQIIYLCHQFGMSLGIATSIRVSTMLGSGDAVGAKRSRCVRGCARITLETGGLRKKAFSLTVCRDLCVVTGEGENDTRHFHQPPSFAHPDTVH